MFILSYIFPLSVILTLWPPIFRSQTKQIVKVQLKIHQSQPKIYTLFWRFDLITRSSSEEAGTQFFRVLMRRSAVASRLGRTQYQLLLIKISWWDRNVKIRYKFGCDWWIFNCIVIPTKWIYFSKKRISVVKPTAIGYVLLTASNVIVPAAVVAAAAAAAAVASSLVELVKADPVIVDSENSQIIDFNLQCH